MEYCFEFRWSEILGGKYENYNEFRAYLAREVRHCFLSKNISSLTGLKKRFKLVARECILLEVL